MQRNRIKPRGLEKTSTDTVKKLLVFLLEMLLYCPASSGETPVMINVDTGENSFVGVEAHDLPRLRAIADRRLACDTRVDEQMLQIL
jgi:hypothetical protein